MSVEAPENAYILNIANTYGVILVGVYISSILFGVSCTQIIWYFRHYTSDPITTKLFVAYIALLAVVSQIMIFVCPWSTLISHWGSLKVLEAVNKVLASHVIPGTVVLVSVQFFFLHHIYRLGRRKWMPLVMLLALCSIFTLATAFPLEVMFLRAKTMDHLSAKTLVNLENASRACPAVVDICLAVSMVVLLHRDRKFMSRGTLRMITRLTIVTVNCGVWTAIAALLDFILTRAFPSAIYYAPFEIILPSLYINSAMANLNAREYVKHSDISFNSIHISRQNPCGSIPLRNIGSSNTNAGKAAKADSGNIAIQVQTETTADSSPFREDKISTAVSYSQDGSFDMV